MAVAPVTTTYRKFRPAVNPVVFAEATPCALTSTKFVALGTSWTTWLFTLSQVPPTRITPDVSPSRWPFVASGERSNPSEGLAVVVIALCRHGVGRARILCRVFGDHCRERLSSWEGKASFGQRIAQGFTVAEWPRQNPPANHLSAQRPPVRVSG